MVKNIKVKKAQSHEESGNVSIQKDQAIQQIDLFTPSGTLRISVHYDPKHPEAKISLINKYGQEIMLTDITYQPEMDFGYALTSDDDIFPSDRQKMGPGMDPYAEPDDDILLATAGLMMDVRNPFAKYGRMRIAIPHSDE